MNLCRSWRLPSRTLGTRPGPVDQDQRRRILRPHVGRREVALDLVHPLDEAVHPLEPVRLHVAHDRVSSISLRPLSVTCCRVSPSTNDVFLMGTGSGVPGDPRKPSAIGGLQPALIADQFVSGHAGWPLRPRGSRPPATATPRPGSPSLAPVRRGCSPRRAKRGSRVVAGPRH